MRAGGDSRGRAEDRRRRAQALLDRDGDGETVRCAHCGRWLTTTARLADHPECARLEQDRRVPGGSYVLENLVASCGPCNKRRSNRPERFELNLAASLAS